MIETNGPALIRMHLDDCKLAKREPDLVFINEIAQVTTLYMWAYDKDQQTAWHTVRDNWLSDASKHSHRWRK